VTVRVQAARLAFQRIVPDLDLGEGSSPRALLGVVRGARATIEEVGGLGGRTVREATVEFNAMCEGLANAELRGGTLAPGDQQRIWRDAFTVVVNGFAAVPRKGRVRTMR
jgi:hypothetical protein